jgi:lysophospholipase L1-like esterase
LVFVSLIITLLCLEIGARVYLVHASKSHEAVFTQFASTRQLYVRYGKPRFTPHRYVGYITTPGYSNGLNKHNSFGFRGDEIQVPKPAGVYRIACLGGSTTYDSEIEDYRKSFAFLLQENLRNKGFPSVDVVNAGAGNYTSWESLINFELRVLDTQPDMIIIYHAINDVHTRLVWPYEAYKADNSGQRACNKTTPYPFLLDNIALLRIISIKLGHPSPYDTLNQHILTFSDTCCAAEFVKQKVNGTYPSGIFKTASAMEILRQNKPIYFKRNIENLIYLARSRNMDSVLVTFASSPLFEKEVVVSSQEYIYALAEMNDCARAIAGENNVPLFDLEKVFPMDKQYYTDGRHLTEKGAALKAELVADFLTKNNLIPVIPGATPGK